MSIDRDPELNKIERTNVAKSDRGLVTRLKDNYARLVIGIAVLSGVGTTSVIKDPNCHLDDYGREYCMGEAIHLPENPVKFDPINSDEREGMLLNRNRS